MVLIDNNCKRVTKIYKNCKKIYKIMNINLVTKSINKTILTDIMIKWDQIIQIEISLNLIFYILINENKGK